MATTTLRPSAIPSRSYGTFVAKSADVPAVPSTPTPSYFLEYRTDPQVSFWNINEAAFWLNAAGSFWATSGEWLPWIGVLNHIIRQQYEFRLTVNPGVQGTVTALTVNVDMPDVEEEVLNVSIGALGTRVPLTKTYQSIKVVSPKLLEDGGTAAHIKIVDKDLTGPLLKAYDSSNVLTTAHADVTIQGY